MRIKQLAYAIGMIGFVGSIGFASAAEEVQKAEKIEVTGSSIKRLAKEGSVPVQTFTKEDIAKTGVTTVADLVAQLPAMQGFVAASDSVGGSGGGTVTASLHDLGDEYTLVLLNGRRLAPSGAGSAVDLNSIPLSIVERVEVLTDGASALYGSDAIAGVINFILKKNQQGFQVSGRMTRPQEAGGRGWNAAISAGFGDYENDGFNILAAYSHDRQDRLKATQRDFSDSGIISFQRSGDFTAYDGDGNPYTVTNPNLYFFNGSSNAIPGGARVVRIKRDANGNIVYKNDDNGNPTTTPDTTSRTFNPYLKANGQCAVNNSQIGNDCYFDYTSTIEIIPESDRDSFFTKGRLKITDNISAFTDIALSKFVMTTRIAPYPTGFFPLPSASQYVTDYVRPYMTAQELADFADPVLGQYTRVDARWRSLPAGNRTTKWTTDSQHVVAGVDANLMGWDASSAFTHSVNKVTQDYPEGWLLATPFLAAMQAGQVNPFVLPDQLTQAEKDALAATVYHGNWDVSKTKLTGFDVRASRAIAELPAGEVLLGVGADVRKYHYTRDIAAANANEEVLFLSKDTAYDLDRTNFGMYGEVIVPVLDTLELTAGARYDNVGKVTDNKLGTAVNSDKNDTTYKVSARYQPNKTLVLRGSVGTGFKMPTLLEIGEPMTDFGVTSGNYGCPFPVGDALRALCINPDGKSQVNVYRRGNKDLKPETSDQFTVGFVFEPTRGFNVGLDLWQVKMKNQVTRQDEAAIFADPVKYRNLFTSKTNLATGEEELAIIQEAVNVGKSVNRGIDFSVGLLNRLPFGSLNTNLSGTYLLKSEYTVPGSESEWTTSLGKFGNDQEVSFRTIAKLANTLQTGKLSNTMTVKYRSGYADEPHGGLTDCGVTLVSATGDCVDVTLDVPSYTTVDWQASYAATRSLVVKAGVNNVFNRKPPLSLRTGGSGHQVGYDPRYTDSFGRSFYMSADYQF